MRKTGRKKGKLAVQINLIVIVAVLTMLYIVAMIVANISKSMYIQSHDEQIRIELEECRDLFMNPEITGWVLDQWQQNPELVREAEAQADTEAVIEELLKQDPRMIHLAVEALKKEDIEAMEPENRDALLILLYQYVVRAFEEKRAAGRFDNVVVIDIRNDDELYEQDPDDCFVILECSAESDEKGNHGLGTYRRRDETYVPVKTLQYGSFGRDYGNVVFREMSSRRRNILLYTAAEPVFMDGKIRYVVCLEYNWSSFANLLDYSLNAMSISGIPSVLIVTALLYLFIYRKAIRPLVQVNGGVLEYMKNKDSDAAAESMAKVRVRNEIGVLADNVAAMTKEIDRSTAENLRLNSEREKAETELELAARIQKDSLPKDFPDRPEIQLSASMDPAKEVGGDFYDFFLIDDNHLGLVIADVSGKGVPAALFMMMAKNMIKNYALMGLSPAEVMDRTNASLCENNRNNMFVTVWFGILDLSDGHVKASNAGHEYPMIRKDGGLFEMLLDQHGLALGLMVLKPYTEYEFDVEKGGTLFVYTDGAPEATDAGQNMFGTDRMTEALNREADAGPETLIENMKSAIDGFVAGEEQFDDTTMLCVRMRKTAE